MYLNLNFFNHRDVLCSNPAKYITVFSYTNATTTANSATASTNAAAINIAV